MHQPQSQVAELPDSPTGAGDGIWTATAVHRETFLADNAAEYTSRINTSRINASSTMKLFINLLLALAAITAFAAENDQIPTERKTTWTNHVLGGTGIVPLNDPTGGIESFDTGGVNARTTVFLVSDYASIQDALNASSENSIVLIDEPGTYGGGIVVPTKRTLRGLGKDIDGNWLTILSTSSNTGVASESNLSDWGADPAVPGKAITGGLTQGSTTLTLASGDTADFTVGRLARIEWENMDDDALLEAGETITISPNGAQGIRRQMVVITAKTSTTLTISPGIHHAPHASLSAVIQKVNAQVENVGIEDLAIQGVSDSMKKGVAISQGFNCWIKNVRIDDAANYPIQLYDSLNIEVRGVRIEGREGSGTNGAGILSNGVGNALVEDNEILSIFPAIEVNFGSTGNVFAYNLMEGNGTGANINHGGHNSHNLYEGNVTAWIQSDGYHGSASEDTIFRNWLHGSTYGSSVFAFAGISLNRFCWYYNVVGNTIGTVAYNLLDPANPYSLGNPNLGNSYFEGTHNILTGDFPTDWKMTAELTNRVTDYEGVFTLNSGTVRWLGGESNSPGQFRMYSELGEHLTWGINTIGTAGGSAASPILAGVGVAGDEVFVSARFLWFISGTKDSAGDLVGSWSTPQQLSSLGAITQQRMLQAEFSVNGTTGWHYGYETGDEFMRTRADTGSYSAAVRITGETSVGGANYTDYRFSRAQAADYYLRAVNIDSPASPNEPYTENLAGVAVPWSDIPPAHSVNYPAQGTTLNIKAGIWGYQDKDDAVAATVITKANTIMFAVGGPAIRSVESIGSDTLPASLFRTSKPAYFGDLGWPAFGPGKNSPSYTDIPAGARYLAAIPPILNSAVIGSSGTTLTISLSKPVTIGSGGSGGWTVTFPDTSVTYLSGNGTSTLTYSLSRVIADLEVGTVSYSSPNNGLEDNLGNDLEAIDARTIYNYSTNTGGAIWYGFTADQATATHVFAGSGYTYAQPIEITRSGNIVAVRGYVDSFDNSFTSKFGVTDAAGNWLTIGSGTITENGNYFRQLVTTIHVEPGTYHAAYAGNSNSDPTFSVIGGQPANSSLVDTTQSYANVGSTDFTTSFGFTHKYVFGILLIPDPEPRPIYSTGKLRMLRR